MVETRKAAGAYSGTAAKEKFEGRLRRAVRHSNDALTYEAFPRLRISPALKNLINGTLKATEQRSIRANGTCMHVPLVVASLAKDNFIFLVTRAIPRAPRIQAV